MVVNQSIILGQAHQTIGFRRKIGIAERPLLWSESKQRLFRSRMVQPDFSSRIGGDKPFVTLGNRDVGNGALMRDKPMDKLHMGHIGRSMFLNGSYPLWRHLLIYVNKAPNKPLDPLVKEFIKFIYSKEGQAIVIKDGFFPLPQTVIERELVKVE